MTDLTTDRVTLRGVVTRTGVAGELSITANVVYPGEPTRRIQFVGSIYGGPVVMISGEHGELQTFVADPDRFGNFPTNRSAWLHRFFDI